MAAQQMCKDPIVEEIHAVRRRIAEDCDYDITRIMDLLRKREAEHPEGIVRGDALPRKLSRRGPARPGKARVAT